MHLLAIQPIWLHDSDAIYCIARPTARPTTFQIDFIFISIL